MADTGIGVKGGGRGMSRTTALSKSVDLDAPEFPDIPI
jgi:hypothetical protein